MINGFGINVIIDQEMSEGATGFDGGFEVGVACRVPSR